MRLFLTAVIRQVLIFLAYLLILSLLLFNHKGGMDILFYFLLIIAATIHLIWTTVLSRKKREWINIPALLIVFLTFALFSAYYMDLMWWVTRGDIKPSVDSVYMSK